MNSMQDSETVVIGGVDAHSDTHEVAALDARGALLGSASFSTTFAGYAGLLDCLRAFGRVDVVAIESTGAYAAGLVRYLREHDIRVLEVNQPHAHTRRRRGKSDPIDAEMAARLALAGKATTSPKQTDEIVESIRLLRVTRDGAVKARSAAMVQLSQLIITAPQPLREQLAVRRSIRGKAALCRKLRPALSDLDQPTQAAKLALRSLARRIEQLDAEIAELDEQLKPLVARAAPRTTQLLGISTTHAGQLLVTAAQNIERLRGEACVRGALRRKPDPRVLRPHDASSPQLRRRPRRQPSAAHDCRLSPALLRAHAGLRRVAHQGRQDQARDHPLPEALHRPRGLPRAHRRPRRPRRAADPATTPRHRDHLRRRLHRSTPPTPRPLTSIGTSERRPTMCLRSSWGPSMTMR